MGIETALFTTIELMEVDTILTIIATSVYTILLVTYFITPTDSATLVICTLLSMSSEHPFARYRTFLGIAAGAVVGVLLLAAGLKTLQTALIIARLPYLVILILTTWGFYKLLYQEFLSGMVKMNKISRIKNQ